MTAAVDKVLVVTLSDGQTRTLEFTDTSLTVKQAGKKLDVQVPLRQVIGAYIIEDDDTLELNFLAKATKKSALALIKIEGKVQEDYNGKEWADSLMELAYKDVKRRRKLKVLINPHGGQGKANTIFKKEIEPIFTAAGCLLDVNYTTHAKHAVEISKSMDLEYDALVSVSGDGLIHEVMNGFAQHPLSAEAFKIPIAPIPAGSGNGTCLNLLGVKDGFDVGAATLNAIKGQPMKVDLFSFVQGETKTISFMSQSLGLMAELDIGTDNWRWMGDTRFFLGFLRGLIAFKSCPIELQIKVAEEDKSKMAQALKSRRSGDLSQAPSISAAASEAIPPLSEPVREEDGWVTFTKSALFLYAGKGPYVGRDLMQFPVSLPDDGLIDVVVQERTSRYEILDGVQYGATGQNYWLESQHYFKASAYRVKPQQSSGYLSIDGESYPFEPFQVEVHKGLGTLMSPYGYYVADFEEKKPQVNGPRKEDDDEFSAACCCL